MEPEGSLSPLHVPRHLSLSWVRSIHAMPPSHFLKTPFNIVRPPQGELFLITFRHPIVGRTPLDEGSAHPRDVYLITHNIHNRHDIHISSGFQTRNPSKRSAADPCLTNQSLWRGDTNVIRHTTSATIIAAVVCVGHRTDRYSNRLAGAFLPYSRKVLRLSDRNISLGRIISGGLW